MQFFYDESYKIRHKDKSLYLVWLTLLVPTTKV